MGRGEISGQTEIMGVDEVVDHSIMGVEDLSVLATKVPIEAVDMMEGVVAPRSTPEMDLHYRMSPMVKRKRIEGRLQTSR